MNAILGKLLRCLPQSEAVISPIASAVLYLLEHFRENPTLGQVASHVGFTPTYFSALFKQETGETFKHYLDRLRFDYAAKLLSHTDMTVMQICRESGFEDYPNFVRRFKCHFGVSPGEKRQKDRDGTQRI